MDGRVQNIKQVAEQASNFRGDSVCRLMTVLRVFAKLSSNARQFILPAFGMINAAAIRDT